MVLLNSALCFRFSFDLTDFAIFLVVLIFSKLMLLVLFVLFEFLSMNETLSKLLVLFLLQLQLFFH